MSAAENASRLENVAAKVTDAIRSQNRDFLQFAAKAALDAYDSEPRVIYLSMYAECKVHLNTARGYQEYRRLIRDYRLSPSSPNPDIAVFFARFAAFLSLQKASLDPERNLKQDALDIALTLLPRFMELDIKEQILLGLLENHRLEQVEELAERVYETHPLTAKTFLLAVDVLHGNLLSGYNFFCDLAALFNQGKPVDTDTPQEVVDWFNTVFDRFGVGMRLLAPATEGREDAEDPNAVPPPPDSAPVMYQAAEQLAAFIIGLLNAPPVEPDFEREMSPEQIADAWLPTFGRFHGPADESAVAVEPSHKIVRIDPATGGLELEAL